MALCHTPWLPTLRHCPHLTAQMRAGERDRVRKRQDSRIVGERHRLIEEALFFHQESAIKIEWGNKLFSFSFQQENGFSLTDSKEINAFVLLERSELRAGAGATCAPLRHDVCVRTSKSLLLNNLACPSSQWWLMTNKTQLEKYDWLI